MINRLSKRALQKILGGQVREEATCVVKFYSNNCHYCHALKDEYETIADNNEGIEFYAFNIDDYPQVQKVMNFRGVPTISLIKTGTTAPKIRVIKDPEPPNKKTYYTSSYIQTFIDKEKG